MAIDDKGIYAYNYLIKQGVPPIQASGIVGNLKAESNFDTTVKGTADDKGSVGLAQWHSGRKKGLYSFAKQQGRDWGSMETQLDYIVHELNQPAFKTARNKLFSAQTPEEATLAFMNHYERPAEWAKRQSSPLRINTARMVSGLTPDPNFKYQGTASQQTTPENPEVAISSFDLNAPTVSGQIFEAPTETEKEGVAAAKELTEESFVKDYQESQAAKRQALIEQEYQQQMQPQEEISPVEIAPITYQPIEPPQYAHGGIVQDNNGYWNPENWGKQVQIDSPNITMQGVNQPLIGTSVQTGEVKLMLPNEEYFFENTKQVIESPTNKRFK